MAIRHGLPALTKSSIAVLAATSLMSSRLVLPTSMRKTNTLKRTVPGAGVGVYAQRVISSPGKKDGLYWPDVQGNDVSPLGEFVAEATAQGYRVGGGRTPYHGYYYKILTQQGPAAAGGELDYVVHGKMIGGFALVAYPAEYRNSGVMTFIVNHAGVVYQKDLGPHTSSLRRADDFV